MCKRFQDCGFVGNKAVSNCIHTWPLWRWDVSAICKSNCNENRSNQCDLTTATSNNAACLCLAFSRSLSVDYSDLKGDDKGVTLWALNAVTTVCKSRSVFFSIIFIIMWNACSCIGWTLCVSLFEDTLPLPIYSSTRAGLKSCRSLCLLQG